MLELKIKEKLKKTDKKQILKDFMNMGRYSTKNYFGKD